MSLPLNHLSQRNSLIWGNFENIYLSSFLGRLVKNWSLVQRVNIFCQKRLFLTQSNQTDFRFGTKSAHIKFKQLLLAIMKNCKKIMVKMVLIEFISVEIASKVDLKCVWRVEIENKQVCKFSDNGMRGVKLKPNVICEWSQSVHFSNLFFDSSTYTNIMCCSTNSKSILTIQLTASIKLPKVLQIRIQFSIPLHTKLLI